MKPTSRKESTRPKAADPPSGNNQTRKIDLFKQMIEHFSQNIKKINNEYNKIHDFLYENFCDLNSFCRVFTNNDLTSGGFSTNNNQRKRGRASKSYLDSGQMSILSFASSVDKEENSDCDMSEDNKEGKGDNCASKEGKKERSESDNKCEGRDNNYNNNKDKAENSLDNVRNLNKNVGENAKLSIKDSNDKENKVKKHNKIPRKTPRPQILVTEDIVLTSENSEKTEVLDVEESLKKKGKNSKKNSFTFGILHT